MALQKTVTDYKYGLEINGAYHKVIEMSQYMHVSSAKYMVTFKVGVFPSKEIAAQFPSRKEPIETKIYKIYDRTDEDGRNLHKIYFNDPMYVDKTVTDHLECAYIYLKNEVSEYTDANDAIDGWTTSDGETLTTWLQQKHSLTSGETISIIYSTNETIMPIQEYNISSIIDDNTVTVGAVTSGEVTTPFECTVLI